MVDIDRIEQFASDLRHRVINLARRVENPSHLGGVCSMIEVFSVIQLMLFDRPFQARLDEKGTTILSKGHSVLIIYAFLIETGQLLEEDFLENYERGVTKLLGHPVRNDDLGIEFSTGSLGMGLGLGVGKAISYRYRELNYPVAVFVGDGELGEGSNYEAMITAAKYKLGNLVCIVDVNGLQQTGETKVISGDICWPRVFESFGWQTVEVCGHDVEELVLVLTDVKKSFMLGDKPLAILANTIKGKGLGSELEGKVECHHFKPEPFND